MNKTNAIEHPPITPNSKVSILQEILQEIEATPQEYWSKLLKTMRIFRKTLTIKTTLISQKNGENQQQETDFLTQQHQALKAEMLNLVTKLYI